MVFSQLSSLESTYTVMMSMHQEFGLTFRTPKLRNIYTFKLISYIFEKYIPDPLALSLMINARTLLHFLDQQARIVSRN